MDDFPIADWVNQIAEGEATYKRRTWKKAKTNFLIAQMKVFVEASILVETLNREYPLFNWSVRLLSLH